MASQNQWVYDLENLTYAIVKTRCEKKLKTKYPKLKFTQEEQSDSATASFPTVLVQALEPIEQNEDLECERINTVLFTAQSMVPLLAECGSLSFSANSPCQQWSTD